MAYKRSVKELRKMCLEHIYKNLVKIEKDDLIMNIDNLIIYMYKNCEKGSFHAYYYEKDNYGEPIRKSKVIIF